MKILLKVGLLSILLFSAEVHASWVRTTGMGALTAGGLLIWHELHNAQKKVIKKMDEKKVEQENAAEQIDGSEEQVFTWKKKWKKVLKQADRKKLLVGSGCCLAGIVGIIQGEQKSGVVNPVSAPVVVSASAVDSVPDPVVVSVVDSVVDSDPAPAKVLQPGDDYSNEDLLDDQKVIVNRLREQFNLWKKNEKQEMPFYIQKDQLEYCSEKFKEEVRAAGNVWINKQAIFSAGFEYSIDHVNMIVNRCNQKNIQKIRNELGHGKAKKEFADDIEPLTIDSEAIKKIQQLKIWWERHPKSISDGVTEAMFIRLDHELHPFINEAWCHEMTEHNKKLLQKYTETVLESSKTWLGKKGRYQTLDSIFKSQIFTFVGYVELQKTYNEFLCEEVKKYINKELGNDADGLCNYLLPLVHYYVSFLNSTLGYPICDEYRKVKFLINCYQKNKNAKDIFIQCIPFLEVIYAAFIPKQKVNRWFNTMERNVTSHAGLVTILEQFKKLSEEQQEWILAWVNTNHKGIELFYPHLSVFMSYSLETHYSNIIKDLLLALLGQQKKVDGVEKVEENILYDIVSITAIENTHQGLKFRMGSSLHPHPFTTIHECFIGYNSENAEYYR